MKTLVIIGESEYSKVVAKTAKKRFEKIIFIDINDYINGTNVPENDSVVAERAAFFVALTNSRLRRLVCVQLMLKYCRLVSFISPKAFMSRAAETGANTIVMNGAMINDDVIIGNGVIIDTDSSVGRGCIIGDYSTVFSGASLGCNVEIGKNVIIKSGARIQDNVKITDNVIIGPNTVVTKDITMPGTYEDAPAYRIPDVFQLIKRKYKS